MPDKNPESHVELTPGEEFPKDAFSRTVVKYPKKSELSSVVSTTASDVFTLQIASFSETVPKWGVGSPRLRDKALRDFWKSEDLLSGAVYSVCTRNAALEWEIKAPPETKIAVTNMLNNAIAGTHYGWIPFIQAFSQDLYTQDNGAFIEIIRQEDKFDSPVIGIANLDSARCVRTGKPDIPVIYLDKDGRSHKLKWWNVIPTAEFPSPDERTKGIGFCAVSRVLRIADILKNIALFKNEKVSGRFYKQIHFVGGVSRQEINDIMERGQEGADNSGQARYILPEIIASLDPEKPVSTATIDLASLPDNFDLDIELKWYITGLAMGFGVDYQDFAPLPGGNLGTSTQSETLHRKSRAKSPKIFMETIQNIFHYYGVLPRNARFLFRDKDLASDLEEEKLVAERAGARAIRTRSGEITPQVARMIALREGDLTQEEFDKIPPDFGVGLVAPDQNFASNQRDTVVEDVAKVEGTRPVG